MKKAEIEIRKSSIDGFGIFPKKPIKKGQYIGTLEGPRIHYETVHMAHSNRYDNWIGVGNRRWIDPINEFEYLNHSCNPSAGFMGTRVIKLFAMRDISPEEEITIDYSTTEYNEGYGFENTEPPHPKFRKYIESIQSLPVEVYKSYLPYIPEYFKKVYERDVLLQHNEVQKSKH